MSSIKTPARAAKRRGIVVLAAGAVLLTGCSSVDLNPGQAAVVNDDTTVSASSVDDTVSAACHYIEIEAKENPQSQPLAISDLRSSFTTTEVLVPLYEDLLDELGLTIRPADVEKLAGQNVLPEGLTEDEQDILTDYFHDVSILNLSQALIGSNATDPTITDSSQLTTDESAAGADVITAYLEKQDVDVNPQYGTWEGTSVTFSSGSLSTPVSDTAQPAKVDPETGAKDVSGLPPSQVCGA